MAWEPDSSKLRALWDTFLETWPPDRVRAMGLEDYTNLNRDDSFCYWLEKRTETLGSIWGGTSFKFGVYRRDDTTAKENSGGRSWSTDYAWQTKYGASADEAWQTVHERLVQVIEAAQEGDLERVEAIDVCWPIVKWKIAFLYQNQDKPKIFPVYRDDRLLHHYRLVDPTAKRKTGRAVLYPTLLDRYSDLGGVFEVAKHVWNEDEAPSTARYWAVPLHVPLTPEQAKQLCGLTEVNPGDYPPLLDELLTDAEVGVDDHLALMLNDHVLAVGVVESAEPGVYVWRQRAVDLHPDLTSIPSEVEELDAAAREAIWGALEDEPPPGEVRYWKLAAGEQSYLWDEWKDGGYIAIGWDRFGDVSRLDRAGFEKLMKELQGEPGYGPEGPRQVWRFAQIRPGDRVLVNRGTGKVLGVGTVTGSYEHHPEAGEYCHRFPVTWDPDFEPLDINEGGFRRTLIELDAAKFERLTTPPEVESEPPEPPLPPAGPCPPPQSLILFGPPGTGKTWSTMERALQLLLGREAVAPMRPETRAQQFRKLQREGRIELVTFHQAYGYEEFVEGIRPVLDEDASGDVRYEVHAGVFKRIALRAAGEGIRAPARLDTFDLLWDALLADLREQGERIVESVSGKSYTLRATSRGNLEAAALERDDEGELRDAGGRPLTASRKNLKLLWERRADLGTEPDQITNQKTTELYASAHGGGGGHHFTAVWLAYRELLLLSRSRTTTATTTSPSFVQEVLDRPQAGTVDFQFSSRTRPYVLIIDEINRGNISKILGELITLLEADKRLGAENELKLPLAYSPQHRFAVPPNLHIIGTMNTADRSIALMDVALRRRFRFEEMMPSTSVIRTVLAAKVANRALIDLTCDLVDTMNARIRLLYDRDHQIGHAYFLDIRTVEDLRDVFADRVIPLLQEYFYGAWDKVCLVLGCPYDEDGRPLRAGPCVNGDGYVAPVVHAVRPDQESVLGFAHEDLEPELDFEISAPFRPSSVGQARPRTLLLQAFLGVLQLDQEDRDAMLLALTPEVDS